MFIIYLFCLFISINCIDCIHNFKIINILQTLKSPNSIIISNTIYKTVNYNVFSYFIKEQLMSPTIIKESIYIPIIALYFLNEYLNFKYKDRNTKLDYISNERFFKLKKVINQIILIFNIAFIRDIENAS